MRIKALALVVVAGCTLIVLYPVMGAVLRRFCLVILEMRNEVGPGWLILLTIIYTVLLAIPFVPGLELGLLIMVLFGSTGAIIAYAATVMGLLMSFVAGHRLVTCSSTKDTIRRIPLWAFSSDIQGAYKSQPRFGKFVKLFKSHPHFMLAVLLNFPGNAIIGGGGGIAFLSGAGRQFKWLPFALTTAVATAPLPLLVIVGKFDPIRSILSSAT